MWVLVPFFSFLSFNSALTDAVKELKKVKDQAEQATTLQEMVNTLNQQKLTSAEQIESLKRSSADKELKLQKGIEELSLKVDQSETDRLGSER